MTEWWFTSEIKELSMVGVFLGVKNTENTIITCLTLLDLSAAFDTLDHSNLLERLTSWFGISSTALSWIKSYLLNRSFYINIENSKSFVFQLLYRGPQLRIRPWSSTLHRLHYSSVLSNLTHQQTTNSMLMMLNFSCHSQLWISLITSLTLKIL